MIQTRELFPATLSHALLANRVATVLAQIERSEPVDRSALDEAVEFLHTIRDGREFTRNLTVRDNSYQAALAYGEAIRAIEFVSEEKSSGEKDIDQLLDWLVKVAQDVRDEKQVERRELGLLDRFFRFIANTALASTGGSIERVEYLY